MLDELIGHYESIKASLVKENVFAERFLRMQKERQLSLQEEGSSQESSETADTTAKGLSEASSEVQDEL